MATKKISNDFEVLKDKSFKINLTVPQSDIKAKFDQLIKKFSTEVKVDGFRKGKVPLNVAKDHLSEEKVIEEVFSDLVTALYSKKIDELHLSPIVPPQIVIKNPPLTPDKEWQIEISACNLPEIELDDKLFEQIKKINKAQPEKKDSKIENEQLNQILDTVVKTSKLDLPQILVDHEVEHKMSHLVDQVNQAGLSINQYLKSKNLSLEKFQESLVTEVRQEWVINLAITKIAQEQKLNSTEAEVHELLEKAPHLNDNHNLAHYVITQQKVFEFLKKL
jgi:trigger factor